MWQVTVLCRIETFVSQSFLRKFNLLYIWRNGSKDINRKKHYFSVRPPLYIELTTNRDLQIIQILQLSQEIIEVASTLPRILCRSALWRQSKGEKDKMTIRFCWRSLRRIPCLILMSFAKFANTWASSNSCSDIPESSLNGDAFDWNPAPGCGMRYRKRNRSENDGREGNGMRLVTPPVFLKVTPFLMASTMDPTTIAWGLALPRSPWIWSDWPVLLILRA